MGWGTVPGKLLDTLKGFVIIIVLGLIFQISEGLLHLFMQFVVVLFNFGLTVLDWILS